MARAAKVHKRASTWGIRAECEVESRIRYPDDIRLAFDWKEVTCARCLKKKPQRAKKGRVGG